MVGSSSVARTGDRDSNIAPQCAGISFTADAVSGLRIESRAGLPPYQPLSMQPRSVYADRNLPKGGSDDMHLGAGHGGVRIWLGTRLCDGHLWVERSAEQWKKTRKKQPNSEQKSSKQKRSRTANQLMNNKTDVAGAQAGANLRAL